MKSKSFIPVNLPLLSKGNEYKYLKECIDTGWISSEGRFVKLFEEKLAKEVGRKYAVSVSNGSTALDLALYCLNLEEGDEVIMPTFTIISCITCILRAGGKPVLVDCHPDNWNINEDLIEDKITSKTKAILIAHMYGLPSNMEKIINIAEKYDLKIIEDAAEAHGVRYHDKKCGSFGLMSTFSFYPNKNITTGEGGMILTDNEELHERLCSLRNLAFDKSTRFLHHEFGWNYRMSNLQAAVGLAQLEKLDQHIKRRKEIGSLYNKLLDSNDFIQTPVKNLPYSENLYWVYGVILKLTCGKTNQDIMKYLRERNVDSRSFFIPMHQQPAFLKLGYLGPNETFPVADFISKFGLYLPSGLGNTDEQIEISANVLINLLEEL